LTGNDKSIVIAILGTTLSASFPLELRIGMFPLPVPVFLVAAVLSPKAVIFVSI
jgi:hypothetical protein